MIWGALLMSIVIYIAVLEFSAKEVTATASDNQPLVFILAGVALVNIFISVGINRLYIRPAAKKPDHFSGVMNGCIVSWALAESAAIFGLVLGFLGSPRTISALFFAAGFITMLFVAPKFAKLREP